MYHPVDHGRKRVRAAPFPSVRISCHHAGDDERLRAIPRRIQRLSGERAGPCLRAAPRARHVGGLVTALLPVIFDADDPCDVGPAAAAILESESPPGPGSLGVDSFARLRRRPRIVLGQAPPSATDAGSDAQAEAASDAGADAQAEAGTDAGACATPTGPSVTLREQSGTAFTLSNTLVTMTIDATGRVTGLVKNGTPLIAEGQTLYVSSEDATAGDASGTTERKSARRRRPSWSNPRASRALVHRHEWIDELGYLHYVMQAGLSGF